jgi:uncharacterized membrane protein YdjX (TVP38/TMEM64 family)
MVVDDRWLRIGSANFCNRSMGTDTECDLAIEAGRDQAVADAIRAFRDELLAEHLDVAAHEVSAAIARAGSLNGAIQSLQGKARTLSNLQHAQDVEAALGVAALADPERPVSLDKLIDEFAPSMAPQKSGFRWSVLFVTAAVLLGLVLAWRFTPLAQVATPERFVGWAHDFAGRWWAPLLIVAAYTPACFVMFPRPLITLFAVVAFGTKVGVLYAFSGIMIAAEVTYFVGRLVDRGTVRRVAGAKLNRVSEILRRRGLIAVTALRLVPLAPFAIEGLVAGAIRIKLWHFTVGTAIGIVPGTLATILLGDQIENALHNPGAINYWPIVGAIALLAGAAFAVRKWFLSPSFSKSQAHHP